MSKSVPVLAMVTQPGPVGWCYDSVILSLALPGHTHTCKKNVGITRPGLEKCEIGGFTSVADAGHLFKTGQSTYSLIGTSASLAVRDDVEHCVYDSVLQCASVPLPPLRPGGLVSPRLFAITTH